MPEDHATRADIERLEARLEARLENYATRADIERLEARLENYSTKADIERLEARLQSKMEQTQGELKLEMLERLEQVETTLLREFHKWAIPTNARFRVAEITSAALLERMTLAEERITDLEINTKR